MHVSIPPPPFFFCVHCSAIALDRGGRAAEDWRKTLRWPNCLILFNLKVFYIKWYCDFLKKMTRLSVVVIFFFFRYFTLSVRLNNRPVELVKLSGFRPRLDIKVSNPPKVRYHQSVSKGKAQYIFLMRKKKYWPEFQVLSRGRVLLWSGVKKKESHLGGGMTGVIDDADAQTRRPQTSVHPSKEKPPRCCKVWWNAAGKRRMNHIQLSKL